MTSPPAEAPGGTGRRAELAQLVLRTTPIPLVLKSGRGVYLYVNPAFCRLFDRRETELVGATDEWVLGRSEAVESARLDEAAMHGGEVRQQRVRVDAGTVRREFSIQRVLVRDLAGEVLGLLATYNSLSTELPGKEADFGCEQMVSICASCKRVSDAGRWEPIELYMQSQLGAKLTHGLCPECLPKFF